MYKATENWAGQKS